MLTPVCVQRAMCSFTDYVSVKGVDRSHGRKQSFLILFNLKAAYQNFKEKHPTIKIGFSKFAEFRPKECVLQVPVARILSVFVLNIRMLNS